ncbi:dual specificity protein phosphatase PHS1-like [Impatiens glandulifera]|uniref:dual specificity protein phosphatase PHS1-like n=1 Tax=Impatiens glandulifera TaxID=253017 RepID=UPI001FB0DBB7|nr:dual specificity protein phosphatase PHS1-like [Impatiens glandulifera]
MSNPATTVHFHEEGEIDPRDQRTGEPEPPSPLALTSRALFMLGDIAANHAYRFTRWLETVRKRTGKHPMGFPQTSHDTMPLSVVDINNDIRDCPPSKQATEISLWDRLGKASMLVVEPNSFPWNSLSSLHHIAHCTSSDQSEDEMIKALEVTVNSGGVVFFALFNQPANDNGSPKEAAAVIKFSSSRMSTQSERLGYEFAKWLGIRTPQARVIHNSSSEWQHIKEAAEKTKSQALLEGDEVGELTCSELLEALELSRCLLLMNYVHGSILMDSSNAFNSREAAQNTAAALGRILVLDLVIRNEDRFPCRQLGWRGNSANLLLTDKMLSTDFDMLEESFDSAIKRYRPKVIRALHKERRATSVERKLSFPDTDSVSNISDLSDINESPRSCRSVRSQNSIESTFIGFHVVAIDSGVPRRPPASKRASDQTNYPKLVELLINCPDYSSGMLHEITGGRLGSPLNDDVISDSQRMDMASAVHAFRNGFRAALRDMQGFHMFLLTLHQKLDSLLRTFMNISDRVSSMDFDKEDLVVSELPSNADPSGSSPPTPCIMEQSNSDNPYDLNDHKPAVRSSLSGLKENMDSTFTSSRDSWHVKSSKASGEPLHSMRLPSKLRDICRYAKVDSELNKDLEQWSELLRNEVIKLCHENNFNSGFFEGNDHCSIVDAYELKVRLEHILERIPLISDAANTEKPSQILSHLFIGGALAARSVYTLQHLGITHILCLCSNEIGQSDNQFPELFEYKNISVSDSEDANISSIFEEAHGFIEHVEQTGGKVLVHCFEGKSRSATVVIAYLMIRNDTTLSKAWNILKQVHRRAQPNDGFAKVLVELDKKLHGKVSMEWQKRKPTMKVCSICGKKAGLSSSSLKLHLQKAHKKLSSGSVDSAMTMEIEKAITALKMNTVSPKNRESNSIITTL